MKTPPTQNLVIPSNIPWDTVKGRDLEECIYWLLEALGAKSLDWRLGGKNDGAADGGRDLECVFHVLDPSGEMNPQRWWVEAKGRKGSVSPADIKESVHTVAGRQHVDVHLIVTNQQLSNPTKDWVANWQKEHPRPIIRVWERQDLERLATRHPSVVVRMFPKALTDQGRAQVVKTRFWDYSNYADAPTLHRLWKARAAIEWDHSTLLAVLASECANGDLGKRRWAQIVSPDQLGAVFLKGMANAFYVLFRADAAGIRYRPYQEALAHLLVHLIARFDPAEVAIVLLNFTKFSEQLSSLPDEARNIISDPIITMAINKLGESCMTDCSRMMPFRETMTKEQAEAYWSSFKPIPSEVAETEEEKSSPYLILQTHSQPCSLGLKLTKRKGCPYFETTTKGKDIVKTLISIKSAVIARTGLKSLNMSLRDAIIEHCEE